ncbi:MAG: hypothetical protein WC429_03285 [Verrucomicrobiia bacterium]
MTTLATKRRSFRGATTVSTLSLILAAALPIHAQAVAPPAKQAAKPAPPLPSPGNSATLRAAINDLVATFGPRYPKGAEFLRRLDAGASAQEFAALQREALVANPLVNGQPILFAANTNRTTTTPRRCSRPARSTPASSRAARR